MSWRTARSIPALGAIVLVAAVLMSTVLAPTARAADEKLTPEDRLSLTRELSSEFATAKVAVPRSKDALKVETDGSTDQEQWLKSQNKWGVAVKVGDLMQITKIEFKGRSIVLEINGGFNGGKKWWQRLEISGNSGQVIRPIGSGQDQQPPNPFGTVMAIEFPDGVPSMDTDQVKEYLATVMDFERRTASEQYIDTLPEPVQAAIQEKRPIEGMDQDMVVLAMGRPVRKIRETVDGVEVTTWVYGEFPGTITFVKFRGGKVFEVHEEYAAVGGTVAPDLEPNR